MKKNKDSWLIKGVIGFFAVSVVFVFITAAQATYITNYIKPVQVGLPVANTDAATKAYVDTVSAANSGKQYCNSTHCFLYTDTNTSASAVYMCGKSVSAGSSVFCMTPKAGGAPIGTIITSETGVSSWNASGGFGLSPTMQWSDWNWE